MRRIQKLTALAIGLFCVLGLALGTGSSAQTSGDPVLTVEVSGPGIVADDQKQISCPGTCQGKYDGKATVTLTATPLSGATFDGWGKGCSGTGPCVVDMSKGDQTVTASFSAAKPSTSRLEVAVDGPGKVTDVRGKISCPGTCGASYEPTSVVGLTATPDSGATFQGWGGACAGTPKCAVDMSKGDQKVVATFLAGASTTPTPTTPKPPPSEDVCRTLRAIDAKRQAIRDRKLPSATAARLDVAVVKAETPLIPKAVAEDCVIVLKRTVARPFTAKKLTKVKPRPIHDHKQGDTDEEMEELPPAAGVRKSLPSGPPAKLVHFKGGKAGQRGLAAAGDTTSPVRVFLRTNLGPAQGIVGYPLEPQVESAGGVIFVSGNSQPAISTDDGRTFRFLPSVDSMFGVPEGRYVGDSVVRYAPQIDRFLWLMQYDCTVGGCPAPPYNRYRLAVASPSAIRGNVANPERAWRVYNLTAAMFGESSWFDFPIMSVGRTQLFLTWNSVGQHAVNARLNLHQLELGGPVAVYHFTHGSDIFWRTAEHAGTTGYWIQNGTDDGHAVVYHLDDASGLIFWDTVEHDRIPQFGMDSNNTLDTRWNGRGTASGAQVASAIVRRNTLWIAWTAGRRFTESGRNEWPQPHVFIARYALPSLERAGTQNVWSRDIAIVGPGLTVNPEGDVAMEAATGGPSQSPRPAAGLVTGPDTGTLFELWTSDPAAGAGQGDYEMVEPEYPSGDRLVTVGYVTNNRPTGVENEYVFMRFGRRAADLRPPSVHIDSPTAESSWEVLQPIPLRGSAYDEEDGTITGDRLIWRYGSIIIGRGTSAEYRPLGTGDQTITLSVTDSGRRTGTASVRIHVGPRTTRPSVVITSPENGTNFPRGPTAIADFEARATDPSGTTASLRWTDEYTTARGERVRIEFGAGRSASTRLYTIGYSPTPHRITVTATNARGQTATDTITVTSGVYG